MRPAKAAWRALLQFAGWAAVTWLIMLPKAYLLHLCLAAVQAVMLRPWSGGDVLRDAIAHDWARTVRGWASLRGELPEACDGWEWLARRYRPSLRGKAPDRR